MYLKSILFSPSSVTLAVAPDEPDKPNDPDNRNEADAPEEPAGARAARTQRFVLSPREWALFNRALGYDPAAGLALSEGVPLDERMFTLLEEAAERTAALRYAARLLSAADTSGEAVRRRLVRKGFSPASADAAVRRLTEKGLLDDASAAARCAETLLASKRYGRRRILAVLLERGFSRELARDAAEALDPDAFADAIDALVLRRAAGLLSDDPDERRRAAGILLRLGYSGDEIRAAARRARER